VTAVAGECMYPEQCNNRRSEKEENGDMEVIKSSGEPCEMENAGKGGSV